MGTKIQTKFDIRGHFDAIRDMIYVNQLSVLATVADDCQIKLWNFKNI